jgi:ATP-binding cassette subfamily F protein uup
VQIAFFDQLRAQLDLQTTVLDNVAADREEVVIGGTRRHVYSYLQDFLFTPDRARTPVKALSGGERARLLLAKLFLQPGNLLVMDEPTNDLDVETLELLEEQLLGYPGTLLLVSHDRTFLDNVVTSTFVLDGDGRVGLYPGGYETGCASGPQLRRRRRPVPHPRAASRTEKDRPARLQRTARTAGLPGRIEALENEIASLQTTMCDTSLYQKAPEQIEAARTRLPLAEAELEAAFNRWAELEERAARLE